MRPFLIPSVGLCTLALVVSACSSTVPDLTRPTATATPTGPVASSTPVATATPVGPTATPTVAPTNTPAGPTATPLATATPVSTATPTAVATATPVATPTPVVTATPGVTPTPIATAQPQIIYVSFSFNAITDPTFGPIAYYGNSATAANTAITTLKAGSQIVFDNIDTARTLHSASGLGEGTGEGAAGFPASFTNSSGATASGTMIDGGTTWSSGKLGGAGGMSTAFTLGPPGDYYYGCVYHYASSGMMDVIVSQ